MIDLGAQYVHGSKNNPVFEIASQHNLVAKKEGEDDSDCDEDDVYHLFFTSKGQKISDPIVEEVCTVLDNILEEGDKFARKQIPLADEEESVGTFVHREFYKYLRTCSDDDEVTKMKEGIFNWRLLEEKTDNACKSVYEMSLYAWGEYMECPGSPNLELKHGFQSILDVIVRDIPSASIKLNTAVKCIYWDTLASVNIPNAQTTNSGTSPHSALNDSMNELNGAHLRPVHVLTTDGTVFSADHLIVTSSVGFLKKNAHTMFQPLLPNDKLAVIHR